MSAQWCTGAQNIGGIGGYPGLGGFSPHPLGWGVTPPVSQTSQSVAPPSESPEKYSYTFEFRYEQRPCFLSCEHRWIAGYRSWELKTFWMDGTGLQKDGVDWVIASLRDHKTKLESLGLNVNAEIRKLGGTP